MQCVYLVLFTCSAHCKYHIITHTVQCVSRHQPLEYQSATREIQQTLPTNSPRCTAGSNVGTKRGNSVKISKHFNEKTTFLMTWLSVWEQLTLASTAPSLTSAFDKSYGIRQERRILFINIKNHVKYCFKAGSVVSSWLLLRILSGQSGRIRGRKWGGGDGSQHQEQNPLWCHLSWFRSSSC